MDYVFILCIVTVGALVGIGSHIGALLVMKKTRNSISGNIDLEKRQDLFEITMWGSVMTRGN